ncbi:MAG: hypothetical protein M1823_002320 [Watsoniomyces obsoletus]|nr:MAG: hypothetical protein M1823_002320 [Watsoniomyces obsoletus]
MASKLSSVALLQPADQLSPFAALQMAQQAPQLLNRSSSVPSTFPFSILQAAESPEVWTAYEHLLLSCLRTRDDQTARRCLGQLTRRFGASNPRIMGLQGLYDEAVAKDQAALDSILRGYELKLTEDPTNMPVAKRRVALLRSLSRPEAAIEALVKLLDDSPADAEAWSELSDLYLSQGLYPQAIFSLEEVLLITPNAWNIHARMGEMMYLYATAKDSSVDHDSIRRLIESMRWFCRSVELCDDYLRGYYGLKMATNRLVSLDARTLDAATAAKSVDGSADQTPPSPGNVKRLNELASAKLAEIVKRSQKHSNRPGHDVAEVMAAKKLLDEDQASSQ